MHNKYSMIVAYTQEGIIGHNNNIPWYIPKDLISIGG